MYLEYDIERIGSLEEFRTERKHFEGLGFEVVDKSKYVGFYNEREEEFFVNKKIIKFIHSSHTEDGYTIFACDCDFSYQKSGFGKVKHLVICKTSAKINKETLYYKTYFRLSVSGRFDIGAFKTNKGFLLRENREEVFFDSEARLLEEYDKRVKKYDPIFKK